MATDSEKVTIIETLNKPQSDAVRQRKRRQRKAAKNLRPVEVYVPDGTQHLIRSLAAQLVAHDH